MSRKPVAPVVSQEGVSKGAPGEPVSGPSTSRARVFLSTDVVCSYCGARPGQKCTTRQDNGERTPAVISHNVRATRAEQATKRWAAWHGDKQASAELPPL